MEIMRRVAETGAIDLAIGTPGFNPDQQLVDRLVAALRDGVHQYEPSAGLPLLRAGIAQWLQPSVADVSPENVTITCGASEGLMIALHTVIDPGDEVVVLEPAYEGFAAAAQICGARVRVVRLGVPEWAVDIPALERALTPATRAVILNSPHNPTGKVFTREELSQIGALCAEREVLCIADEVYSAFGNGLFVSALDVPDLAHRTLCLGSFSKALAVSGWRIGFLITPPGLTHRARHIHQAMTAGAPSAPQHAIGGLLADTNAFRAVTESAAAHVREQGLHARAMFTRSHLHPTSGQGGCFFLAELSGESASIICTRLIERHGVAVAPGTAFWADPAIGERYIRVAFNKGSATIAEAARRLGALRLDLCESGDDVPDDAPKAIGKHLAEHDPS